MKSHLLSDNEIIASVVEIVIELDEVGFRETPGSFQAGARISRLNCYVEGA